MTAENLPAPSSQRRSLVGRIVLLVLSPFLGMLVGLMVAGICLYVIPKTYESTAVVQITPRPTGFSYSGGGIAAERNRNFLANELQVIQSDGTLEEVGKRLDLASRWDLDQNAVIPALRTMIELTTIEGTDLVEIRVRDTSPELARDIAATVAVAYCEGRISMEADRVERAFAALNEELRAQEMLVEDKREVMYTIAETAGIPHHREEAAGLNFALGADRELLSVEKEIEELKVILEAMTKLEGEELFRYVAAAPVPGNGVAGMLEEYEEQVEAIKELEASGLARNHPQVQLLMARLDELEEGLAKAVDAVGIILQTQLDLSEVRLVKLRGEVQERRDLAVSRALESHDYLEAKQDYENALVMLQKMELMQKSKQIALKIPHQAVTVHSEPRVSKKPVSPRVGLTLAAGVGAGAGLGLLTGILVFFLGGRRREEEPTSTAPAS